MAEKPRPLSPHLGVYKWQPSMAASIMHRTTGIGMATVGALIFLWWLLAAVSGPQAYELFLSLATSWAGLVVLFGLTMFFFQHLLSGLRHLFMDTGAGFEPAVARRTALLTFVGSILLSVLTWIFIVAR